MHCLSCHVYIGSIVLWLALHHEKQQQGPPISSQGTVRNPSLENDNNLNLVIDCRLFHIG